MSIIRLRTLLLALALSLVGVAGGTGVAQAAPCSAGKYRAPVDSTYYWTQDACLFVDSSGRLSVTSNIDFRPGFRSRDVVKAVVKFRLRDQTNGTSYQAPDVAITEAAKISLDTTASYKFGKGTVGHYYYVEAWMDVLIVTGAHVNSGQPTRYPITGVLRR